MFRIVPSLHFKNGRILARPHAIGSYLKRRQFYRSLSDGRYSALDREPGSKIKLPRTKQTKKITVSRKFEKHIQRYGFLSVTPAPDVH